MTTLITAAKETTGDYDPANHRRVLIAQGHAPGVKF